MESAGTVTVTTTSTSTETPTFQAIPSTEARETNGIRTAGRAIGSADPRLDLGAFLARDLAPASALGRLCSLGGTYRSKRAEIGAAPLVAVGKRDDSKAMVVRSAITNKAGARKSKAIGDDKVGPAGRTGPRSPHALAPPAADVTSVLPAAEVEGVRPMRDLGLI